MGQCASIWLRLTDQPVATSVIVAAEIHFGLSKKPSERLQQAALRVLGAIEVLAFDQPAEVHYGDIRATLQREGQLIGGNDMLIAAHARARGMTLVTHNTKAFERVAGLNVVDWLA